MATAVNTIFKESVKRYRNGGLDMRYILPPIPFASDLYGEGRFNTHHPNNQMNIVIADAIARTALEAVGATTYAIDG
jgi:hypothetical protein